MANGGREASIIIELFNKSEEVRDIFQNIKETEVSSVANGLIQVDNDTAKIISEEISRAGITSRLVTLLKHVCRLNKYSRAIAITPLLDEGVMVGLINAADENILCSIEALFLLFHIIGTLPVNAYILEFFVRALYSDGLIKNRLPVINIESLKYLDKSTYWRLVSVVLFVKMILELHEESEEFVRIEDYLTTKNDSLSESVLVILWQFATNSDILNSVDVSCNYYNLFSDTYEKIETSIVTHLEHQVSVLHMMLNIMLKVPKETLRQETVIFLHSLLMIQQLCRCSLHSKQVNIETLYSELQQESNLDDKSQKAQEFVDNKQLPPTSQYIDTKQKKGKARGNKTHKNQIFLSNLRTTVFITKEFILDLCVDDETELFLELFNRRSPCQRMLDLSRLCAREGVFDVDFVFLAANQVYKMREQKHRPKDKRYTSSSIKKAINTANKLFNIVLTNINYDDFIENIIRNHLLKGNKMQQALEFNHEELIKKLLDNFVKYSSVDNKSSQDYWTLCSNASRRITWAFQKHLEDADTETMKVSKLTKTNLIVYSIPLKLVHLQLVLNPSVKSLALCIAANYIFSFMERRKDVESVLIPKGNITVNRLIVKDTILRLMKDGNPVCRRLAVSYISRHLYYGVKHDEANRTLLEDKVSQAGESTNVEGNEYDDFLLDELMEQIDSQLIKPDSQNKISAAASYPQLHTISMNQFAFIIMLSCLSDKSRAVQDAAMECAFKRLKEECEILLKRDDIVERARMYATISSFIIPMIAKGIIILDNDIHKGFKQSSIEERSLMLRDMLVLVIELLMEISKSGLIDLPERNAKELSLADALTLCVQKIIECIFSDKMRAMKRSVDPLYKDIKSGDIPLNTLKSVIHSIAFIALTGGVNDSENDNIDTNDDDDDDDVS